MTEEKFDPAFTELRVVENAESLSPEDRKLYLNSASKWLMVDFPQEMKPLIEEKYEKDKNMKSKGLGLSANFAELQRKATIALSIADKLDSPEGDVHDKLVRRLYDNQSIKGYDEKMKSELRASLLGPVSSKTLHYLEEQTRPFDPPDETTMNDLLAIAEDDAKEKCDYISFAGYDEQGRKVYNVIQLKANADGLLTITPVEADYEGDTKPIFNVSKRDTQSLHDYAKKLEKKVREDNEKKANDPNNDEEIVDYVFRPYVVEVPAMDHKSIRNIYGRIKDKSLYDKFRQAADEANYFVETKKEGEVAA